MTEENNEQILDERKAPTKLTFLVPTSSSEATTIFMSRQALTMAIVGRDHIRSLDKSWDCVGVYLLIGPSDEEATKVYAGKSTNSGLIERVAQHSRDKNKQWFERALVIADQTENGFSSAEAAWLESELAKVLFNAPHIDCMNGNQPIDDTLPWYEHAELRRVVKTVISTLRVMGINPDTRDQIYKNKSKPKSSKKQKQRTTTVADLIKEGLLAPGTKLYCTWGNRAEMNDEAEVTSDGKIKVGDDIHDTPSGAANAVRGGAANGWTFWGVQSDDGSLIPLGDLDDQF